MADKKEMLGTYPVGKLLFRLALPTVVAQLINMLYNVVDRIFIGHMPDVGDLALTGVGVCMPIIMIVSAFAALVSSGGAPRASIFMGEKNIERAEKTLGGCFALQIIVSAILTAVLLIFNRDLLLAFGASEHTIEYATDYMSVYAIGTVFVQLTLGMNAFITAQGFTKTSMISVIVGAASNIILDPILIYGFDMGVRGAALATVISQALSCVWVVLFLCGKNTILKLRLKNMIPLPKIVLPCIALGAATFIMQASESVISVCFNSSLLAYGGDIAVGAMTILTSVMQFALLPTQGIAQGAQPILSYNYGAKNADRVRKTYKILLTTCLIYSVTMWALVMLIPEVFVSIFTPKAELVAFASKALRIYFAGMILFGIQISCQMTFVSLGNALSSVAVAVVRKFVLLLPLIYIVPSLVNDRTVGVYLAEPIADILAVTFTAILFAFKFKKSLSKIEAVESFEKDKE
ncbi:MAG: MATE family efflux transporter [Ruminococcaceae bacterium]|nr:MATE family efflux transporter [Oscillospiraceae bacterium]